MKKTVFKAYILGPTTDKYTSQEHQRRTLSAYTREELERVINNSPRRTIVLRRYTEEESTVNIARDLALKLDSRFASRAFDLLNNRGEGFDFVEVEAYVEMVVQATTNDEVHLYVGPNGYIVAVSTDGWAVQLVSAQDDDDVQAFRADAANAGDLAAVNLCERALAGDAQAIDNCLTMLVEARLAQLEGDLEDYR